MFWCSGEIVSWKEVKVIRIRKKVLLMQFFFTKMKFPIYNAYKMFPVLLMLKLVWNVVHTLAFIENLIVRLNPCAIAKVLAGILEVEHLSML